MKLWISIFLVLFLALPIAAQSHLDSLIIGLDTTSGISKIEQYNKISIEYRQTNPEESIKYARKAFKLARILGKDTLKGESLHNIATGFYFQSDMKNAKIYYNRAIRLFEKIGNKAGLARAYNNMALVNKRQDDFDQALSYLLKSLVLEEELGNKAGLSSSLLNIGNFYYDIEDRDKALDYYQQALKIEETLDDKSNLANILNNIGVVFDENSNYHYAIDYYLKSLELEEYLGRTNGIATTLNNIGIAYQNLDIYALALEYLLRSLDLTEKINDPYGYNNTLINIGILYLHENELDKSLSYLNDGVEMSIKYEFSDLLMLAYDGLHKNYDARKEYDISLEYFRLYTNESGKILNQINRELIEEIQKRYEIEKQQLIQNDLQVSRQITLRNSFMILIVILLMVFFAVANLIKNKENLNFQLKVKNDQLIVMNEKLEEVARTDPLTLLSNRRDMMEKIDYEKNRFSRSKKSFIIIISDIDYFKQINDKYGHDGGDFVLTNLSRMFRQTMRKQDIIGRWGGEEFIFLLPETDLQGGGKLAEKLRTLIQQHTFYYQDKMIKITMTFGVSIYNKHTIAVQQVINKADEHLYEGKRKGRNCVITDKNDKVVIG